MATSEQYALFRGYIDDRHHDGGMSDMSMMDFTAMVDETFVDTNMIEYRLPAQPRLSGPDNRQGNSWRPRSPIRWKTGCR
jgi:arginyl-tRNA--protein-N-Asp/Glu arginylyltransferase